MSLAKPTADEIISAADSSLEGDNRHFESAQKIWDVMKPFINPGSRIAAAKALADGMETSWEHNLKYVTE